MDEMIWAIAGLVTGFCLLIAGGELLVRGASRLASAMRISPLVIGLTVVAFGTSSPELAVSVQSAFAGNSDIAIGNVVGSNILNVLLILGVSALIVPLVVASQLIRRDVPLMVAASIMLWLLGLDGKIGRTDGLLLSCGLIAYVSWCIRQSRRESHQQRVKEQPIDAPETATRAMVQLCLIAAGLALLGVGSKWLIGGAVTIATYLGVSQLIIGLTIVAAGTSLPEVVTSIMAAWRGERDIAVGNVVGSNLFNISCVLGISSIVAPAGIEVSHEALTFDIPVMIVVAAACLPIFFTGNLIARWEGGLFLFYYFAYTMYLVLDALGVSFGRTMGQVMLVFVVPLTFLTLMVGVFRSIARGQLEPSAAP